MRKDFFLQAYSPFRPDLRVCTSPLHPALTLPTHMGQTAVWHLHLLNPGCTHIIPLPARSYGAHVTPPPSPDTANPYGTNSCVAPAPPEPRLHTHHPTTCQILWCDLACSCCASAALQQAPPCHSTVHVRQSRRGSLCIGHPGLGLHGHTFCGLLLHIFGKPWVHLQGNTCLIQVSESLNGGQLHDSSKVTTGVLVRSLCVEAAALTQG